MTRKEELITASHDKRNYPCKVIVDKIHDPMIFSIGAEWADQHPIDEKIKEILLAYTKWLDKRGFFKEELQCDFHHQIETFLEMKGEEK